MTDHQCETPMIDHVARFWRLLKTEYVTIRVDIRRSHEPESSVTYHWDTSVFSDDVAKAIMQPLLEYGSVEAMKSCADSNADSCRELMRRMEIIRDNSTDPAIVAVANDAIRMSWLTDSDPI